MEPQPMRNGPIVVVWNAIAYAVLFAAVSGIALVLAWNLFATATQLEDPQSVTHMWACAVAYVVVWIAWDVARPAAGESRGELRDAWLVALMGSVLGPWLVWFLISAAATVLHVADRQVPPAVAALGIAVLTLIGLWTARTKGQRLMLVGWTLGPLLFMVGLYLLQSQPPADLGLGEGLRFAVVAFAAIGLGATGTAFVYLEGGDSAADFLA